MLGDFVVVAIQGFHRFHQTSNMAMIRINHNNDISNKKQKLKTIITTIKTIFVLTAIASMWLGNSNRSSAGLPI